MEKGTCDHSVEEQGGKLRRKGIFREGTAWAKGKPTQATCSKQRGVHLKYREREEMRLERVAGITLKKELYSGICGGPQRGAECSRLCV